MNPRDISIDDFTYELPEEKIATHPLPERDQSKLLIYKNEKISEDIYKNIAEHIAENSLLIFNNTKVIQARVLFKKETGGAIEIFCLEPYGKNEYTTTMSKTSSVKWKCMVGGAGKWKSGLLEKKILINNIEIILKAELKLKLTDAYMVEFNWQPSHFTFAEIIEQAGEIPLPPYIKRNIEEDDKVRYQTIYAQHKGSVAAPTAGLHFTENVFSSLKNKNIQHDFVTLHVGAGTFKPVKAHKMEAHEMHAEWINVSISTIENILRSEKVIAVGTTSLRTIESLYWMGARVYEKSNCDLDELEIKQWDTYENTHQSVDKTKALNALIIWMKKNELETIFTRTQILIVPGYTFRIANGLVTNFHQPKSTLLLLVAAATNNKWKDIYDYALNNNFRFLSYGDGCLITGLNKIDLIKRL